MKPQRVGGILFALVFGVFGVIGLLVIGFLWSQQTGEFGAPPMIVRLVGSAIGLVFVLMGFGGAFGILTGSSRIGSPGGVAGGDGSAGSDAPVGGYRCPRCGAGLGKQEVSPHGDVKCEHCHSWWNIHRAT